jgi:tetratricopeptide (TPR) repeat protein
LEAFEAVEKGVRLKPEDRIIYASRGWMHTLAGDHEEGIRLGKDALSLHPGFPPGHVMLGWAYEAAGMDDLAMTQYELTLKAEYSPPALASLAHLYGKMGQRDQALARLAELDALHERGLIQYVPAYCRALAFAGLRDLDQCLHELECAYDQRCDWLMHLVLDKRWDPVRQTPQFKDLVSRVGIPYFGNSSAI